MSYASPLETRLAKKVTKAITDYRLIEDGDRVMVGLSGGKDSWALFQILDVLRKRAPIRFSLIGVTVDSGYDGFRHDLICQDLRARGWEYRIVHTEIGEVMDDLLDAQATPCSLCARLRRGVLYRLADEVGATKIALGHHLDDFIETLLLNLFFAGTLKAMPAKLVSDNGRHVVIRPLVAVTETDARNYAKAERAADHRLLLPGLRRPRPAAPACQAADRRARGRAPRGEELDDPGAGQRRRRATCSTRGSTPSPTCALPLIGPWTAAPPMPGTPRAPCRFPSFAADDDAKPLPLGQPTVRVGSSACRSFVARPCAAAPARDRGPGNGWGGSGSARRRASTFNARCSIRFRASRAISCACRRWA